MPSRDPDPELAHPEAADWALGILDPDDVDRFAGYWRGWNTRMLALAAAVVIAAAVSAGLLLSRPAPGQAYTAALRPRGSGSCGGMKPPPAQRGAQPPAR